MTQDQFQNQLILLQHHVEDLEKAINDGDDHVIDSSLGDVKEIIKTMSKFLKPKLRSEIDDLAEEVNPLT